MEMALHGEGHEGSGEGGGLRGPNDGGGGAGMADAGVISPNRSALNGMGEFLLSQVGFCLRFEDFGCFPCLSFISYSVRCDRGEQSAAKLLLVDDFFYSVSSIGFMIFLF